MVSAFMYIPSCACSCDPNAVGVFKKKTIITHTAKCTILMWISTINTEVKLNKTPNKEKLFVFDLHICYMLDM